MAKQRRSAVRGSWIPLTLMGITALGMFGLVGLGVAWFSGAFATTAQAEVDHTGQLAFPALARNVSAFERLTRDDFLNPQTRQLNVIWASESLAKVASRDMSELIGRVLSRDKQAGMILSEADFLEKGTRPGLSAGIPLGKFALSVPATGISGLEQLRHGDRFDLLVALPERTDEQQVSNSEPAAIFGGIKPPSLRVSQLSRQHGVKHLVTDGMLIQLFNGASKSTSGPSGLTVTPSANPRMPTPVPTVFAELAVSAEEVGPLTEAISLGTKLTCVLRSGKPTDDGNKSAEFSAAGLVPVITTAKSVAAYSALTDENLIDEATGQLHLYYFPPDKVSESWITDATELYGRVIARSLRRGAVITEEDLLPRGTRPGISAGLKPGMAAMSLAKSKVQGFEKLTIGDVFSILTRVPGEVTAAATPSVSWGILQGGRPSDEDAKLAEMIRTGIREVVRDAVYLSDTDEENVVIGIPDHDVAKLAQLLRDQTEVFAVARSSQAGVNDSTSISRDNSAAKTVSIERPTTRLVSQLGPTNQNVTTGPARTGKPAQGIAVPILTQDVPAFKELSLDDFVDPATGRFQTLYFDQPDVDPTWELDLRRLIDRVAIKPLKAGRPVRTADLAPAGSMAGPALGIPAGMKGVTVNAAQVVGLETLPVGTVFDVVAAKGIEVNALADAVRQSLSSADAVREVTKLPAGKVAASRVIAQNVQLVSNFGVTKIVLPRVGAVTETQTQTRLSPDGSTITETTKSDPTVYEERTVAQYVLAVPEEAVGTVMALLDPQAPLQISLHPVTVTDDDAKSGSTKKYDSTAVRAVVQEHVRGAEISKEVFLTDRQSLQLRDETTNTSNSSSISEGR